MEWRKCYLDVILVPLGFLTSIGYHFWLWHKVRTHPHTTIIGINASGRRNWVNAMMKVHIFFLFIFSFLLILHSFSKVCLENSSINGKIERLIINKTYKFILGWKWYIYIVLLIYPWVWSFFTITYYHDLFFKSLQELLLHTVKCPIETCLRL